jgi:hypothetical protein
VGITPTCQYLTSSFTGTLWDSTEAINMPPGSFGIEDPGSFDPFLNVFANFELEIYAIEGDESLQDDFVPATILMIKTIQGHAMCTPCTALLDSGSKTSWIHERILPAGATPTIQAYCTCQSAAGVFNYNCTVRLVDIILPNFGKTRTVDFQSAHVFSTPCPYDLILGRDFLQHIGLKLDF